MFFPWGRTVEHKPAWIVSKTAQAVFRVVCPCMIFYGFGPRFVRQDCLRNCATGDKPILPEAVGELYFNKRRKRSIAELNIYRVAHTHVMALCSVLQDANAAWYRVTTVPHGSTGAEHGRSTNMADGRAGERGRRLYALSIALASFCVRYRTHTCAARGFFWVA